MPRALNLLRPSLHYRRDCFDKGLKSAGFEVVTKLNKPVAGDALVIWNRYGGLHEQASRFEAAGAHVIVVENGYLGKTWRGGEWFSLALGHHAGAGQWNCGGPERWDSWGVELAPWRTGGHETVIFGQRGIGEPDVRSPDGWAERARKKTGGRIRPHPGKGDTKMPLAVDLANASCAVTWHSGAALQALVMGVPVFYEFPQWIGAQAALPLSQWGNEPKRSDADRLEMFRRLAWAQWTLHEIKTGIPIERAIRPD